MGKDSPLLSKPPVKIFVMGSNLWREEQAWPPADARQKIFYLESAGKANSLAGGGALNEQTAPKRPPDQFVFDPYSPVPTRGGAVCCNPKVFPWGPMDQRSEEHTSELQSRQYLVCRLLLEKKKHNNAHHKTYASHSRSLADAAAARRH